MLRDDRAGIGIFGFAANHCLNIVHATHRLAIHSGFHPDNRETIMTTQNDRAKQFHQLHNKGNPLILFNIWDAGSARTVAKAGAKAIATGSWSVAAAQGYADGEELPLDAAVANIARIAASVDLPVTVDLEAGYGDAPSVVADAVARMIAVGAIGFNLEDRMIGRTGLYSIADQSSRIAAARSAADRVSIAAFINARTDVFLNAPAAQHNDALLDDALARSQAYAKAGANGFFAPGLIDETLIARLCHECPLPVNIMTMPGCPSNARLAELGVARISYGPGPYRAMASALEDAAKRVYAYC
jgi:2-methylisocitrate lyase-like PEP mutase family enzyme